MMIQKNLKGLERMEILITFHVKVFLGNTYNSYIHTASNNIGNLYEKYLWENCNETDFQKDFEKRFSEVPLVKHIAF